MTSARLPDFFIIGAPRCGTTSLHEWLSRHPDVLMPAGKELHHFGSDITSTRISRIVRDPREYAACFTNARADQRIGEASPYMLYSRTAPAEILEAMPDARIVISLRHPADMMHSMHQARLNSGRLHEGQETEPDFATALSLDADRALGHAMPAGAPTDPSQTFYLRYRFLARYAPHVRRWIHAFGGERVHVIVFDDFVGDPAATFARLCAFVGVDGSVVKDFDAHNRGRRTRAPGIARGLLSSPVARLLPDEMRRGLLDRFYRVAATPPPPPDPAMRARLTRECEADIVELGELIGRDLRMWLPG